MPSTRIASPEEFTNCGGVTPREPRWFSTLADRVRNADAIEAHAFWMMRGEIALWSWGLDSTCAFDETDDCLRT